MLFSRGLNIGGNNATASMGAAYGAKVRTKYQTVLPISVFSVLGAVIDGGAVIKTFGSGILPCMNDRLFKCYHCSGSSRIFSMGPQK